MARRNEMCALFWMSKQKVSECCELGALPRQCWCERQLAEPVLARLNLQLPNPTEKPVYLGVAVVPVQVCRPVAPSLVLCLGQEELGAVLRGFCHAWRGWLPVSCRASEREWNIRT